MQVELDSGKRVKVKAANVLLRFDKPQPAELMAAAQALAPRSSWTWPGNSPPRTNSALPTWRATISTQRRLEPSRPGAVAAVRGAALLPPRRQGPLQEGARGHRQGRRWPAIEKKEADRRADRRLGRRAGRRPVPAADPRAALQDPVQARQERARVQGRGRGQPRHAAAPLDLLQKAGAIDSPYQFHWQRFPVRATSPRAPAFPALDAPPITDDLPLAAGAGVLDRRFATTEIDDALSVQGLGSGTVVLGIHIAAPGLAISPAPLDERGRARLSTVYMPGWKITMLPDDGGADAYTLTKGATARRCRCTSRSTKPRWSQGQRDQAGARAHRRQPAPRPARRVVTEAWLRRRRENRPTALAHRASWPFYTAGAST
jgi:exoribonuclease-2